MSRPSILLLLVALPVALVAISLRSDVAPVQADTLAASDQLRWYRGNMYTHSHWIAPPNCVERDAMLTRQLPLPSVRCQRSDWR